MPPQTGMNHRPPNFHHGFAGQTYAAGYYDYIWADMLSADAFEAFAEAGGPYDPDIARRLKEEVFAVGGSVEAAEAFRRFRGRDPVIEPLLRKRGLVDP